MPENTEVVFVERLWRVLGRKLLFLISFALSLVVYGGVTGTTSSPMVYGGLSGSTDYSSGYYTAVTTDNKRGPPTIQRLNEVFQQGRHDEFFPGDPRTNGHDRFLYPVDRLDLDSFNVPSTEKLHFTVDDNGNLWAAGTRGAMVLGLKYGDKSGRETLEEQRTVIFNPPLGEGSRLCPGPDSGIIEIMPRLGEFRVRNQNGEVISGSISGGSGDVNITEAGVKLDPAACRRSRLNSVGGILMYETEDGGWTRVCHKVVTVESGLIICRTLYPGQTVHSPAIANIETADAMECKTGRGLSGNIKNNNVQCNGDESSFKACPGHNNTVSCASSELTHIECNFLEPPSGCSSSHATLPVISGNEIVSINLTNSEAEQKKQLNPQVGTKHWHLMDDTRLLVSNDTHVALLSREGPDENFSLVDTVELKLVSVCGKFGCGYVLGLGSNGRVFKISLSIENKIIVKMAGHTTIIDPQWIFESDVYTYVVGAHDVEALTNKPEALTKALCRDFADLALEKQDAESSLSFKEKLAIVSASVPVPLMATIVSLIKCWFCRTKNKNADGDDEQRLIAHQGDDGPRVVQMGTGPEEQNLIEAGRDEHAAQALNAGGDNEYSDMVVEMTDIEPERSNSQKIEMEVHQCDDTGKM